MSGENTALSLLKADLHISTSAVDGLLQTVLDSAEDRIRKEGIDLDASETGDLMILVEYAAFLYRSRSGTGGANNPVQVMPRPLRWALNNRLFSQKGAVSDDG